jgi:hypothetical protein
MWRRYIPNSNRFLDPRIRTNHSPVPGSAIGRETEPRPAFDRMLTNRTTSGCGGSAPKGCSISNRIRSRPLQNATSASNGNFRRRAARSFACVPGFRTTSVPAAPTFTTSWAPSSLASILGRNVRCPPTLIPRRKTIRGIPRPVDHITALSPAAVSPAERAAPAGIRATGGPKRHRRRGQAGYVAQASSRPQQCFGTSANGAAGFRATSVLKQSLRSVFLAGR